MPPRPRRGGRQAATRASTRESASEVEARGRTGRARTTRSNQTTTAKSSASSTGASSRKPKSAASKASKPNSTHAVVKKATSLDKGDDAEARTRKKAPSSPAGKVRSQPGVKKSGKRTAASRDEDVSPPKKQARTSKSQTSRRSARAIYDEIWKDIYLAGTEWDQINDVYKEDWDFDHLDEALTDGDLAGKKIYLFGGTEPQLIMVDEDDNRGEVVPVPVITAIVSDISPPATVGLKSVQRAKEDIVPMADLRISWQAYAPQNVAFRSRFRPNVHVLKCNQRFVSLKPRGEEAVHKYDYVLPYFFYPDKEDDDIADTVVQVLVDLEGRSAPLMCEFDYEMDELNEFVEETVGEEMLDKDKHSQPLRQAIETAVKNAKQEQKAVKEERQNRIKAMSKEELEGIRNMKLIKFYPQNEWPDVSKVKSRLVNRYYGQAHEVR
ncbi:Protein heat intolerant 4 [Gracilaria domingensis]|nr:Protein heat intolerant 4 [Gracilaria domingensis]